MHGFSGVIGAVRYCTLREMVAKDCISGGILVRYDVHDDKASLLHLPQ